MLIGVQKTRGSFVPSKWLTVEKSRWKSCNIIRTETQNVLVAEKIVNTFLQLIIRTAVEINIVVN